MGVSPDTFLGRIVTKYYPDMKRLFAFVKSLCSICCSEMCGSIMSNCTTGQTGLRTVQHHRSIFAVLRETVGTVVPTGHFRWTRQISWWIYSSHELFDRISVLIIGAFFSKVRGCPFKSAPPTLRECNIMSYCTNIITVAFSPYFKTQLELWFPRTYSHQTCF